MESSQNRILIPIVILSILFGGFYYIGQQHVKESVDLLELEFSDFRLDSFSLLPPQIDITLIYTVTNPSELPLEISMNGAVYYGDVQVTPVNMNRRLIPALGSEIVEVMFSLNGTLLQVIGDPENEGNYSLEGTLSVTGQYFGLLPISVELDLANMRTEK
jgi:hypothetical protein